jgi:murein DD-endopeptidase MepM/ murein hydrolase activator NlpD
VSFFVVALMLAGGLGSVALTGEARRAEVQSSAFGLPLSSAPEQKPATLSFVAPPFVPPPASQVTEPAVLASHTLAPPPCVDDPAHPTYCIYTVESGDTLSGIAQRFQFLGNEAFSAAELLAQSNKPDVVSSDQIVPGQKLRLPKQTGIVVTILSAKTASELANSYGVTADSITAANGFSGEIPVGREVFVPDPQHLPAAAAPASIPTVTPEDTEEPPPIETPEPEATAEPPTATPTPSATLRPNVTPTQTPKASPTAKPSATPTARPDRPTKPSAYGFIWPVWGEISSYFGPGHPLGIDIDLYDDPNAPIAASKKGIVTFAGGNACCSYGLYVIVDHGDGTQTLYAHLSEIKVVQGQMVSQGQLLGFGGSTGYATGNHLHFEIHVGDSVVDPLLFLP